MPIKGAFKYLRNKVCKLSLGCSYRVEGGGNCVCGDRLMQPQLSKE